MKLEQIIDRIIDGSLEKKEAVELLGSVSKLGYAQVDINREKRTGHSEVVFGAGKSAEQLIGISEKMIEKNKPLLITKLTEESAHPLLKKFNQLKYFPDCQILINPDTHPKKLVKGSIAIACAGTSDLAIAEEAAQTVSYLGGKVNRFYDIGASGIHRLIGCIDDIRKSVAIVVIAGMDGVLPTVIGGLVDIPLIAVPTSIGYGANFKGLAPLLTMLNACATGVTVVNIDNGFGAGYAAVQIQKLINKTP